MTGEERRYANEDDTASDHVACTVEMASVTVPCKYFPSLSFFCVCVCVCMLVALVDEVTSIINCIGEWDT